LILGGNGMKKSLLKKKVMIPIIIIMIVLISCFSGCANLKPTWEPYEDGVKLEGVIAPVPGGKT